MIDGDMGATPTAAPRREPLRRDSAHRLVAGVCAGIGRHLRIDPLIVRIVFVAAATAGGVGIVLYGLAWVLVPVDDSAPGTPSTWARRLPRGRGAIEVAIGMGLVTLAFLLTMRAVGIWFADAIVWPVVLLAAGAGMLWRQSLRPTPVPAPEQPPAPEDERRERTEVLSRNGLGVILVVAAGLVFLSATHALTAARDVVLAVLVVAIVLGIIFAPWAVRLVRSLAAEREERIRSQARAEMGAHLHDSVLQTLALVQKRADDPRAVATLARRQERELRSWLSGAPEARPDECLADALRAAAAEVEEAHGVPVEVVTVGDHDLDDRHRALVAAAREALANAVRHSGSDEPIALYVEVIDGHTEVFVR